VATVSKGLDTDPFPVREISCVPNVTAFAPVVNDCAMSGDDSENRNGSVANSKTRTEYTR
jgi:hypothetical protein